MKLTLRPEWRLRPLASFLGCIDLKTGVTIALLFTLLNKVAGVYGLIAVLTGAGGSAAQLSLYFYSVLSLLALAWGLQAISREDAKKTLYFAHVFAVDHVLSTAWTLFFAIVWWVYTPHDGQRTANSPAQEEMAQKGAALAAALHNMTAEERVEAATELWNDEKGLATAVIVAGWLAKIYFALLLYSYAVHLRKGSYRSLPHSRPTSSPYLPGSSSALANLPEEDEEVEDFYRLPVRTPGQPVSHNRTASHGHVRTSSTGPGSSIGSFADFVSAPGRNSRRTNNSRKSNLNPANGKGTEETEILFDEGDLEGSGNTGLAPSASGSGGRLEDSGSSRQSSTSRRSSRA